MKQFIIITTVLLISPSLFSQSLYIPRDVGKAYQKQTRSADGRPGKNYWQNHGRYDINLSVSPPNRNVKGTETIVYYNDSPDTLNSLVIRLFLNIHKPGAPRERAASPGYMTDGMYIDSYSVNGEKQQWANNSNIFTVQSARIPKRLSPHDSVTLKFDWHYEISRESGREGMIDSTTFFLAYFYPRVAVYDDYNGWDRMNFTDGKEFYSDFNDYTVTINTPKNFIVWGTGTLLNAEEVLNKEVAKRFNQSLTSDQVINVVSKDDLSAKNATNQSATNSWKFKARNIADVAFALSDHYIWDATSVIVDSNTRRRSSVQTAYIDTAKSYRRVVTYARNGLAMMSHKWPGVPYPFEKTTAFQGPADMEYPMLANDENIEDDSLDQRSLVEHEIAHSYMPFHMGINESRYGFMDEGWATAFEYLLNIENLGKAKASQLFKQQRVRRWINDPSQEQTIPIITPSNMLVGAGMGNNEYGKAALGYLAVKDLLGDALFKKCLQEYMARWNGKHPIPWDFFYTFNDVAGKNLNWFWHSWFFSNSYIDLVLSSAKRLSNGYALTIKNAGGMPAPFDVEVTYTDGMKETFHQTPSVWEKNISETSIMVATAKPVKSIRLEGDIFMDAEVKDNLWMEKQ